MCLLFFKLFLFFWIHRCLCESVYSLPSRKDSTRIIKILEEISVNVTMNLKMKSMNSMLACFSINSAMDKLFLLSITETSPYKSYPRFAPNI